MNNTTCVSYLQIKFIFCWIWNYCAKIAKDTRHPIPCVSLRKRNNSILASQSSSWLETPHSSIIRPSFLHIYGLNVTPRTPQSTSKNGSGGAPGSDYMRSGNVPPFFFGNSYPYHDGDVAVKLLMHCSKEIKRNHGLCLQMSGVSPVFA